MQQMTDIPAMVPASLDRTTLHAAYADGLDPRVVIDEVLQRVADADDPGIFLHLATAAELAQQLEALPPFDTGAFPLWGLPCAVKDNIDVASMPTTCACPAFAYTPETDATAVAKLRAAGALIVGKTNLDQFATGLVGVRTPYPVPRNAVDATLVPGGSSSGSAVAVASDLITFALGTDTAGSGRVPAALNGIVGLKPSTGAISSLGMVPACRSLDCISVFARSVDDAWSVFETLADYDAEDPFSKDRPARLLNAMAPALVVGVPSPNSRRFFGDNVQEAAFDRDVEALVELGLRVEPVDFSPFYEAATLLYDGAWLAERTAALETFMASDADALHPTTRAIVGPGANLSAVEAFNDSYRLMALRRQVEIALKEIDLLAVPSIPRLVTLAEIAADSIGPNKELGTYTNFANLLDFCGLTVPTGCRSDGQPSSMTLLARGGEDGRLPALAKALLGEAPAASSGQAVGAGELELAVVGAHLSGMALNGEVLKLGGRLVRQARTTAAYRLFALPGAPARPGLLRVADGGSTIDVEVWALPAAAFARFVAAIPAPLGIGRLDLTDGSQPSGFLVEAVATADAEEITSYGGWRAYRAAFGD